MATATKKKMCPSGPSKQCYPTNGAAIKAALSYSKRRGHALRYYYHRECQSYHLTSKARW